MWLSHDHMSFTIGLKSLWFCWFFSDWKIEQKQYLKNKLTQENNKFIWIVISSVEKTPIFCWKIDWIFEAVPCHWWIWWYFCRKNYFYPEKETIRRVFFFHFMPFFSLILLSLLIDVCSFYMRLSALLLRLALYFDYICVSVTKYWREL